MSKVRSVFPVTTPIRIRSDPRRANSVASAKFRFWTSIRIVLSPWAGASNGLPAWVAAQADVKRSANVSTAAGQRFIRHLGAKGLLASYSTRSTLDPNRDLKHANAHSGRGSKNSTLEDSDRGQTDPGVGAPGLGRT